MPLHGGDYESESFEVVVTRSSLLNNNVDGSLYPLPYLTVKYFVGYCANC